MQVYVNGKETDVADGLTVAELVTEKGLNPDTVVVEYNLNVLPREQWPQSILSPDDRLEIVTFMGGG